MTKEESERVSKLAVLNTAVALMSVIREKPATEEDGVKETFRIAKQLLLWVNQKPKLIIKDEEVV